MYKKLLAIDKDTKNKIVKEPPPHLDFKKKHKEIYVKNEIKTLAQENLFMLKRLLEKSSNIDNKQLKHDFIKHQCYKSNRCYYPKIKYYYSNKKNSNGPIVESFIIGHKKDINEKNDKKHNNSNRLPALHKNSSLYMKGKIHKLDGHYYRQVTKALKNSIIHRENKSKTEKENLSCGANKSGFENDKNSFSNSKSGSGNISGNEEILSPKNKK